MENFPHVPSEEQNLRIQRLIFYERLFYRRSSLISQSMNIHQESLPILKSMNLLLALWLYCPLSVLLAHMHSLPQTPKRLACKLLQHVFPKLQFLFCS